LVIRQRRSSESCPVTNVRSTSIPSEKRRKTSKNSQKYINPFLFIIEIELYGNPFLCLVKMTQIIWNHTNSC
jgi:hypothetical protein